jgi:hypothetical protein
MLDTWYYQLQTAMLRPFIHKQGTQCYVVSYPKCGRTWLRLLIGKVLCDQFHLPEEQMIDTYALTAVPGVLRTHFTHDYADVRLGYPYRYLPTDKSPYAPAKVLFLMRDVRDTLVSSYFQATRRVNRFHGSLSDFVRNERYGIKKIVTFYNLWHANQNVPRNFMLLHYEDLHHSPVHALRQTLQFMEIASIDAALLETAVAFASFDNMQKMEAKGSFADQKMQPGRRQDAQSFKVRHGKIGGYAAHLSTADLAYVDQVIQEMGCPFAETYRAPTNLLNGESYA